MLRDFKKKGSSLGVEDVDFTGRLVTLYASEFNSLDSDSDRFFPGAWSKTLKERGPGSNNNRIKHLYNHSTFNLIGAPVEAIEDSKGLRVVSKVSDVNNGDYLKLYRDGVITEHSVGFHVIKSDNNKEGGLDITEALLWEYSAVPWGANENTPTIGMKSEDCLAYGMKLSDRIDRLYKAFRDGDYTDETFTLLEIELSQIKTAITTLFTKAPEPLNSTPSGGNEPTDFDVDSIIKSLTNPKTN